MGSNVPYSQEDIDTFIKEKRIEIDARFTIWSTRLRALAKSGDLDSMADMMATQCCNGNCNCPGH